MPYPHRRSLYSLLLCFVVMGYCTFIFCPRWSYDNSKATISWDAAGYYWPLPSAFIYKDFVEQKFNDSIVAKYQPCDDQPATLDFDGRGHHIFRYTFGTAILYLPFFTVAHLLAGPLGFPADGFSRPYQFAIQAGGLLFAFLGLWYLRKLFLKYYSDTVVAVLLLILCIGCNYLSYSTMDNSLSHSWQFTLYVFLLLNIRQFYITPGYKYAVRTGLLIGLIALVRPPDAICVVLFVLWGMNSVRPGEIAERFRYILKHWRLFMAAAICAIVVIVIQPLYWKVVAGHWLMDTYAGQGFSFLHPHLFNYSLSFRSGWLIYTPVMICAFIGIIPFLRNGENKLPVLLFFFVNLYIVSSWDMWWYAGSGGRAMIQSYPVLLFPLASLVRYVWERNILKWVFIFVTSVFTYMNIWFIYNAHTSDGLYDAIDMNRAYYMRVIGRWSVPEQLSKLMDYDELFEGTPKNMKLLYVNDFEQDSNVHSGQYVIRGQRSYVMDTDHRGSGWFMFALPATKTDRIRAQATYRCVSREWNRYKYSQLMVRFFNKGEVVKEKRIYVDRYLNNGTVKSIYIDVKIPEGAVDSGGVSFWGEIMTTPLYIDDLKVWSFDE